MTTREEEVNSLKSTRQFLFDLISPEATKRIPKEIRKRASRCLKHYPILINEGTTHGIKNESSTTWTIGNGNEC